ncbi:hypothetical protein B0H13DRAFT_2312801 [Mycena leptocephala]|nr:hypothetical protein B0H13DRAFT_2312801 [Mycena leptocephala]
MQQRYLSVLTPEAAKFNLSVIGAYVGFDDEPFVEATNYVLLKNPGGTSSWILAVVQSH